MRRFYSNAVLSALALTLLVGCAPGRSMDTEYRRSVGTATPADIREKVERVIRRYQFQVARYEDDVNNRFWETRWRGRVPFEDEYAAGVNEARTRMIVDTRVARRTGGTVELYRVYVTFENEVQRTGATEWVTMELTPQFEAWAKEIADDLERQLQSGIRVM